MKYKGVLSFTIDHDLDEEFPENKEDIKSIHRALNSMYKKTYALYILDFLQDLTSSLNAKIPRKGEPSFITDGAIDYIKATQQKGE